MKSQLRSILLAAIWAAAALAQTPPDSNVQTSLPLTAIAQPSNSTITPGRLIAQKDVLLAPLLEAPTAANTSTYLALIVDPAGPFLHWLQPNLQPASPSDSSLKVERMSADLVGSPYAYPLPPDGDLAHEYVILLFAQPHGWSLPKPYQSINPPVNLADRSGLDISKFISATGLDPPVGATYFKVSPKSVCAVPPATSCNASTTTNVSASSPAPSTSVTIVSSSNAASMFGGISWNVGLLGTLGLVFLLVQVV